ncbi:MAG TPA: ABC transporter permease [Rhodothermales bacterium]|nr:ABC transporter permease [Rhodothermales bacterium]
MLQNLFKIAVRNIRRHKAQTFINVLGLSVGLACSFLIVLWVQDEMSYDQFHEDRDRIFRVMRHATFGGERGTTEAIPKPLKDAMACSWAVASSTFGYFCS